MPFRIIRDDITRVRADAIVNTANPEPVFGRGTDYAVYKAAGAAELLAERRKIGVMQAGEVCATPAFRLPAKYIFHTVGPGWNGGKQGEMDQLASCYRKSLMLAVQLGLQSIAFPLIATGINGFPKDKALETALETIRTFLEHDELDVTLVVFNKDAFVLSSALARSVDQFIDDNYAGAQETEEYGGAASPDCLRSFQAMRTMVREGKADARTAADMNALDGWLGQLGDDAVLKECYGSGRGGQFFDGRAFEELSTEEKGMARSIARQEMLAQAWEAFRRDGRSPYPELEGVFRRFSLYIERTAGPAISSAWALLDTDTHLHHGRMRQPSADAVYDEESSEIIDEAGEAGSQIAREGSAPVRGSLPALLQGIGECFRDKLLRLIREKDLAETDVYRKAFLDRRHFSKIRCNPEYIPKKQTAVALAFALGLDTEETADLLRSAGLALSPSSKFDLIVLYCLQNNIRDLFEVNALLFAYGQPALGC